MRVKACGAWLLRVCFRRKWLSARVESDPLVRLLRDAVEQSCERQGRPFRLAAADNEEREVEYRLPRILKYRNALYVVCLLLGEALFLAMNWGFNVRPHDWQFGTIPAFITSVIAIALPLVTAFGALRRIGRWAEEYLFRATHLDWFTRETCVAAFVCIFSLPCVPLGDRGIWESLGVSLLTGCAWGLAIATLLYLTAIVLEIIHSSRTPHFACAASANMLSERLLNGFLRNAYLGAFVHAHQNQLERFCKGLQRVDGPGEYMLVQYRAKDDKQKYDTLEVQLRSFLIARQYLDYHLPSLMKLDRLLGQVGSRLCLTPHYWTQAADGRGAKIGLLLPIPTEPVRAKARWFRPRLDICSGVSRHSQEDLQNLFLYEISLRLAEFDTGGYRLYLDAVRRAAREFAALWAELEVRCQFLPGVEQPRDRTSHQGVSFDEVYEWLWLNVRLLKQILHHAPRVEHTPYLETCSFVRCHQDAYQDLLEECVRLGNAEMFGLLLRLLPYFWNAVGRFCESQVKTTGDATEALGELREMRAKWGLVYELPSAFLRGMPHGLDPSKRWRFLLFLHQFACVWIRKAKQTHDQALVANLSEGIANVMETDSEWRQGKAGPPEADLLMARHWLILGEFLQEVLLEQAETLARMPGKLTPEFLQKQEPEQLLRFYASHSRVDEGEWGFEDLRQELPIPMRPLGGGGVGPVRGVPQHEEEMRLAFLWLLLMQPEPSEPLPALAIDVRAPAIRKDLERITEKYQHDPTGRRIWRKPPEGGKYWVEVWLEGCARKAAASKVQEIADATIDPDKANVFQNEFRKNFCESLVLTKFLVDVGAFQLQDDLVALNPKTLVPKDCVIAGPHAVGNTLGDDFGRNYAHALDLEFVRTQLRSKEAPTETRPDYEKGIRRAAEWLSERGSVGNDGLICVLGRGYAGSALLDSEDFVPAWKEAVGLDGFEGRFKKFPVWQARLENETKVVAIDLRSSRPLCVRPRAVQGDWADVTLRELRGNELDEIKKAREGGGKPFEELREKQNCVADITVYAQFQPPEPQQLLLIAIQEGKADTPAGATLLEDAPYEQPA